MAESKALKKAGKAYSVYIARLNERKLLDLGSKRMLLRDFINQYRDVLYDNNILKEVNPDYDKSTNRLLWDAGKVRDNNIDEIQTPVHAHGVRIAPMLSQNASIIGAGQVNVDNMSGINQALGRTDKSAKGNVDGPQDPVDYDEVDDGQKEAMRKIAQWMFRNSESRTVFKTQSEKTGRHSHHEFIESILKKTNKERLLIYYLIEHNKISACTIKEVMESQMPSYMPNFELIKKKMLYSKIMFFKRLFSGNYVKWSVMAAAAQTAQKYRSILGTVSKMSAASAEAANRDWVVIDGAPQVQGPQQEGHGGGDNPDAGHPGAVGHGDANPVEDNAPVEVNAPVEGNAPVEDNAPAAVNAPAAGDAPVEVNAPIEGNAPAADNAPVEDVVQQEIHEEENQEQDNPQQGQLGVNPQEAQQRLEEQANAAQENEERAEVENPEGADAGQENIDEDNAGAGDAGAGDAGAGAEDADAGIDFDAEIVRLEVMQQQLAAGQIVDMDAACELFNDIRAKLIKAAPQLKPPKTDKVISMQQHTQTFRKAAPGALNIVSGARNEMVNLSKLTAEDIKTLSFGKLSDKKAAEIQGKLKDFPKTDAGKGVNIAGTAATAANAVVMIVSAGWMLVNLARNWNVLEKKDVLLALAGTAGSLSKGTSSTMATVNNIMGMAKTAGSIGEKASLAMGSLAMIGGGISLVTGGATAIQGFASSHYSKKTTKYLNGMQAPGGADSDEGRELSMVNGISDFAKIHGKNQRRDGLVGAATGALTLASGLVGMGIVLSTTGIGAVLGVPLSIIGSGIALANTIYGYVKNKRTHRLNVIDRYLNIDKAIDVIVQYVGQPIDKGTEEELRKELRRYGESKFSVADDSGMMRYIANQYGTYLYKKVFIRDVPAEGHGRYYTNDDYRNEPADFNTKMRYAAKSIVEAFNVGVKLSKDGNEEPKTTPGVIISKIKL